MNNTDREIKTIKDRNKPCRSVANIRIMVELGEET